MFAQFIPHEPHLKNKKEKLISPHREYYLNPSFSRTYVLSHLPIDEKLHTLEHTWQWEDPNGSIDCLASDRSTYLK